MKRIIKIFCCLLALVVFTNVYALELEVGKTYGSGYAWRTSRVSLADDVNQNGYSWERYHNAVHYIKENGRIIGPIFCLDPLMAAPDTNGNDGVMEVDRILYDSDNIFVNAEDYAMSTILSKSQFFRFVEEKTAIEQYGAMSYALRTFKDAVLQDYKIMNYDAKTENAVLYKYVNTLAQWAKVDAEFNALYIKTCENAKRNNPKMVCDISQFAKNLATELGLSQSVAQRYWAKTFYVAEWKEYSENNWGYVDGASNNSLALGKQYLKDAMNAYNDSLAGTVKRPTATVQAVDVFRGNKTSTIVLSVDFANFGSDFSKSNFYFSSITSSSANTKVTTLGYNTKRPTSADDYTQTNETNIYKLAGGNKKVYIVLRADSTIIKENDQDCNVTVNIRYKYDDPKLFSGASIRCKLAGTAESMFQRFISFNTGASAAISVNLEQCETMCEPSSSLPENCNDASLIVGNQVVSKFVEGYDEDGKLNIAKCISGNTDMQGNSYAVAEFDENPYCRAYCKEDVDIRSPYRLVTHAGRTIDLDVVITGTQSCYTSKIDYEQYRKDVVGASATEKSKYDALLDKCMNLNIKYDLSPKITYEYQEKNNNSGEMELIDRVNNPDEVTYCSGFDTGCRATAGNDPAYVKSVKSMTVTYTTPRIYYISHTQLGLTVIDSQISSSEMGGYLPVDGLPIDISTISGTYKYKLSFENIGTFYNTGELGRIYGNSKKSLSTYVKENEPGKSNTYACTYDVDVANDPPRPSCVTPDGTIVTPNDCGGEEWNACQKRLCPTPSCQKPDGTIITPNDCGGEEWSKCEKRLCSEDDKTPRCIREKGVYYVCTSGSYSDEPGVCTKYGMTEDDRLRAVKDSKKNINCCPGCIIRIIPSCPSCIITQVGGLNVDYRTVSPSSLNPNNRRMGYNWYYDTDNVNNLKEPIQIKAYYTTTEIEQSETKKFEEVQSGKEAVSSFALQVEMTSAMAAEIREYNKEHSSNGNYTNASIYCEDYIDDTVNSKAVCENKKGYTWENNHCVIKGIFCYSELIDQLFEHYPDKMSSPNRKSTKPFEEYRIDGLNNQSTIKTNGYWAVFPDFATDSVGPSWK